MSAYRLRLPGPTAVPERVREAIARPMVSHRGPEFRATGESDIVTDLLHLESTLNELGWQVAPGAGVAAATKELAHAR